MLILRNLQGFSTNTVLLHGLMVGLSQQQFAFQSKQFGLPNSSP